MPNLSLSPFLSLIYFSSIFLIFSITIFLSPSLPRLSLSLVIFLSPYLILFLSLSCSISLFVSLVLSLLPPLALYRSFTTPVLTSYLSCFLTWLIYLSYPISSPLPSWQFLSLTQIISLSYSVSFAPSLAHLFLSLSRFICFYFCNVKFYKMYQILYFMNKYTILICS